MMVAMNNICKKKSFCVFMQVKSSSFTRLCSTKNILTVNGQFPGPTLVAHRGDKLIVKIYNQANYNITIHWYVVSNISNFHMFLIYLL